MAEPLFDRISQATTSLKHLLGKAVLINEISPEKFDYSFTSILLAFLVADDPTSRWFQAYVRRAGIAVEDILAHKKLDHDKLEEIAKQESSKDFLKRPPSMTESARSIFTEATELMQDVNRGEAANLLDVRHLMGAYIYHPEAHESRLKGWKFDFEAWSNAFLTQIKALFPDEYDRWTEVHTSKFGNKPLEVDKPQEVDGLSTHIASDRWALNDALGYDAYAYAIYRFLTHPETKPPLTISIQAPWGGGKTSLMRMIQKHLDPEALKSYKKPRTTPSGGADELRTTDKLMVKQVRYELKKLIRGRTSKCLFSWDNISRKDKKVLRKFLVKDICIDWAKDAKIEKSNDGTTINIYNKDVKKTKKNSAKIIMDVNNEKATLEIHDGRTYDLKIKKENGKLSIYEPKFRIIDGKDKRLTIWFNVWQYESTEQVWAGLADAIVRQLAERLEPIAREKFLLHLHMRRLDADKIRQRIWTLWWDPISPWMFGSLAGLVVSIILAVTGTMASLPKIATGGWTVSLLLIIVAAITAVAKYFIVSKEPARTSFSEYVNVPDYSARLGVVHHVMEDLGRVFVIFDVKSPMVIFIDDLDRCSPEKVADVVEAINLFLAGDSMPCMFVLGMDPEMVAAALDEAHSKVIAKLPAGATGTPIGWRFMDKFVQLPFVIPPAEVGDLENYARSLLSGRIMEGQVDEQVSVAANDATPELEDPKKIEQTAQELAEKHNLNDEQQRDLTRILEQQASFTIMKRGIDSFSDQVSEIRNKVLDKALEFSKNPRELKRFFNLFRFLFFLMWARNERRPAPNELEQLLRWVKLSIKWPEVVRWLCSGYGEEGTKTSATATRLRQLEDIAGSNDLTKWQERAKDELQLEVKNTPWIADKNLMKFFNKESNLNEKDRLSAAAGNGLW